MSEPEQRLLDQILAARLPAPKTEVCFTSRNLFTRHRPPRPRAWRFDFCWPIYQLVVEVDGGTWLGRFGSHTSGAGVEANREKDAEAMRAGWTILRVTTKMIESGYAIAVIRDLIENRKHSRRYEFCDVGRMNEEMV